MLEIAAGTGFGEGIHPVEEFTDGAVGHLRSLVDEGLAQIRQAGITEAHGHIAFGQPVEQISRLAQQTQAGLIVVGHRHRGLLARWWQGSLSQRLIDQSRCSVLIALHPEDESRDSR